MTFRRGATLPVAVTLGHADTCDLGPTAGNGFYKRWPDDLALLSDLGVTDLRLTFDWARFQPKPGEFSGAWVERYENVVDAARAIGINVWAALYDSGVPRWFVNEGGLDDTEAVTTWWPRWVERVADRFGDRVDGWIPFAEIPRGLPDQVWSDTWAVLGGGEPAVVASVAADSAGVDTARRVVGRLDRLGASIDALADPGARVDDRAIGESAERWGAIVRELAETSTSTPVIISRFTANHSDLDVAGRLVERFVTTLDEAIDDGVDIEACLVESAIAGPESDFALLGVDRTPRPAADAYLAPPDDD